MAGRHAGRRRRRASQVRCDSVAKHLADVLQRAVRGIQRAATFDASQADEDLQRLDQADRPLAEPRTQIQLQPADDLLCGLAAVALRTAPFVGHEKGRKSLLFRSFRPSSDYLKYGYLTNIGYWNKRRLLV